MSSKSGDDLVHIELPDKEPVRDTRKDSSPASLAQSKMKERLFGKNSFITARLNERDTMLTYMALCVVYVALIATSVSHYLTEFDPAQHNYNAAMELISYPTILLIVTLFQIAAMRWASDRDKLRMTRVTQAFTVVLTFLRLLITMRSSSICPQTSEVTSVPLHCNASLEANRLHVQYRISTAFYAVLAIFPIHLMLHMVPVLSVILPSLLVLLLVHFIVLAPHMSVHALLYPSTAECSSSLKASR